MCINGVFRPSRCVSETHLGAGLGEDEEFTARDLATKMAFAISMGRYWRLAAWHGAEDRTSMWK